MGEVARVLGRRDDDRRRAVGLEAAVEQAERLADPRRREVVVHRQRRPAHQRLLVELRVRAERHRDLAGVGGLDVEELLVAGRDQRVELRGAARAVGEVEVEQRRRRRRRRRGRAGAAARRAGAGTRSSRSSRRPRARCGRCPARTASAACWSDAVGLAPPMCTVVARCRSSMPRFAASSSLGRVAGRRDDAVDVGDREAGVGDRRSSPRRASARRAGASRRARSRSRRCRRSLPSIRSRPRGRDRT